MRISFDIDETLMVKNGRRPESAGPLSAFLGSWLQEPLRDGSKQLMSELRRRGCSIWIYTTSLRSPARVRLWLGLYGIRVDGVVNQTLHYRALAHRGFLQVPSKYPPAFDIDLHVDDSEGLRQEGERHGFQVLVINPQDQRWTEKVLATVDRYQTVSTKTPQPAELVAG